MVINEFSPNWISPPSDTIIDILDERNISFNEFANQLNISYEKANDLLQNQLTITLATARQLSKILGGSVEFWITRDYRYRQDTSRMSTSVEQWIAEFPLEDMIRLNWIPKVSSISEKLSSLLHFFDVPDIKVWNNIYSDVMQTVAFKKTETANCHPASVASWIRQGEVRAAKIGCNPWNAKTFQASLENIRLLLRQKDSTKVITEITKYCSESGVAFVIERTPSGCPASGATKFINKEKALIMLSLRYLTDDHFWFSFFHEAGHLLLHEDKRLFVEAIGFPSVEEENEANEFAENILIPPINKQELLELKPSLFEIGNFARKLGVTPGIIVGQLQHLGLIPQNHFNQLKQRYMWE